MAEMGGYYHFTQSDTYVALIYVYAISILNIISFHDSDIRSVVGYHDVNNVKVHTTIRIFYCEKCCAVINVFNVHASGKRVTSTTSWH